MKSLINGDTKMKSLINAILVKLAESGVQARVTTDRSTICVEAECDWMARDVLGFDGFTSYVGGYEVIIV